MDRKLCSVDPNLELAYHLEGQPIAVTEVQRQGNLRSRQTLFERVESKIELGLEWYYIVDFSGRGLDLFSGECDLEVMNRLSPGDPLTIIEDRQRRYRPDINFGRPGFVVAAVFSGEEILYKSPGFDVEQWRDSQSANQLKTKTSTE